MEKTIDLSKITYGFEFVVVMKVKHKKSGKTWKQHTVTISAKDFHWAQELAKASLRKSLQLIEFVSARCTGRLDFAYHDLFPDYPHCDNEIRKQIPVPESWAA